MTDWSQAPDLPAPATLERVSIAIGDLYLEYFGKGPSSVKTYVEDDLIFCVLRNGLTTIERTLFADGQRRTGREMRVAFHDVIAGRFIETVQGITGRSVLAALSQYHVDPDLVIEVFVLDEPLPE